MRPGSYEFREHNNPVRLQINVDPAHLESLGYIISDLNRNPDPDDFRGLSLRVHRNFDSVSLEGFEFCG